MKNGVRCSLVLSLAAAITGGCTAGGGDAARPQVAVAPAVVEEEGWRRIASAADEGAIDALAAAWAEAMQASRFPGFRKSAQAEGPLLDPQAALPRPEPTPGNYMCRLVRLGSEKPRMPAFQAFKPFFCHVGVSAEGQISITKQTGSERPAGYLWGEEHDAKRMIFLGSLALGDEDSPLRYGENSARDMAGVFERIASFRYRLVIPRQRGTAKLDVIEFVPAPVQAE